MLLLQLMAFQRPHLSVKGQSTLRDTEYLDIHPHEENVIYPFAIVLIFRDFVIFSGISVQPRNCSLFKLIAWKKYSLLPHTQNISVFLSSQGRVLNTSH